MSERGAALLLALGLALIPAVAGAVELPAEAAGWVRDGEVRTFVGGALYEHINGGAELYHEYGFAALRVGYYREGEREIVVEVYEMASAAAAHGIYSLQRDPGAAALGDPHTGTRYDLYDECVHGAEYMKLAGTGGATPEQRLGLLQALVPESAPAPALDPDSLLPAACSEGSEVSFAGPLGVQNFARLGDGARFGVGTSSGALGCRVALAGEARRWLVIQGDEEALADALARYVEYQRRSGLEVVEDRGATRVEDPLTGKATVVVAAPGRVTLVPGLPGDVAKTAARRIKALAKSEKAPGP